jgi:(R,R)-butanediol dehydrogenase / meso-butanediol dehydrogenase / diacetyl reductase
VLAAVIGDDSAFELEHVADPAPEPGQLVIRVTACGICGSDLKARPAMPRGTVMGHEFCGEVVAVGKGVGAPWREGVRAAVLPVMSCGDCPWCRVGEVAHCEVARLIGLGGSPGGFAEFATVSADLSFALPAGLPEVYGALVEPFAVGLHTARVAGITSGDSVLVIGAGPVGLTTTRWATVLGARDVVVSDPIASRRELSERLGATRAIDPSTDELGQGFDVVIDCVGKPGLLDKCVAATKTKGRVVVAGVCAEPDPYLPVLALLKELTIAFSVYYRPEEFEFVINAFETGQIDPEPLVTRIVALEQLDSAFASLMGSATDSKILVDPRQVLVAREA